MWKVVVVLSFLGVLGLADTLVLRDGTVLEGRLSGISPTELSFVAAGEAVRVRLEEVSRIALDLAADPKARVDRRAWSRALGQAQREFWNCRNLRPGVVLAGLVFIGFGQFLNALGHEPFGHLLTAVGGLAVLFGLSMPAPGCDVPAARLRALLYIGLEHGWLY